MPDGAWAVVCDGMGGAKAGEVASQNAVQAIVDSVTKNYSEGASDNTIKYLLHGALCDANTVIFNLSNAYESLSGMGTTASGGFGIPRESTRLSRRRQPSLFRYGRIRLSA